MQKHIPEEAMGHGIQILHQLVDGGAPAQRRFIASLHRILAIIVFRLPQPMVGMLITCGVKVVLQADGNVLMMFIRPASMVRCTGPRETHIMFYWIANTQVQDRKLFISIHLTHVMESFQLQVAAQRILLFIQVLVKEFGMKQFVGGQHQAQSRSIVL